MPCMQVRRPTGRKRLKRAGEGQAKRPTDAEEMRAELFGGDEGALQLLASQSIRLTRAFYRI